TLQLITASAAYRVVNRVPAATVFRLAESTNEDGKQHGQGRFQYFHSLCKYGSKNRSYFEFVFDRSRNGTSFSSIVRMIQEDYGTTSSSAPTSIYRWSKKTNQSEKQH
ncbi:unnamed protein product, partial [Nesidiocoris tenuis]